MPAGRPLKFDSAHQIQALADKYFAECKEEDEPITITGLCIALGTFRDVLCDYESGKYDDTDSEFSVTVKSLKIRCENYAEKRLFGNNPTGAIFALKNYGWTDKVQAEVELTTKRVVADL
jgi:hypothetical protein